MLKIVPRVPVLFVLGVIGAWFLLGSAKASTVTDTYRLGPQGDGTTITADAENLLPWITKGTLPAGSILRSVSINARLDAACNVGTDCDNWASDICAYVDPTPEAPALNGLLQVGGFVQIGYPRGYVGTQLYWANGDGGPGTTVSDTLFAGVGYHDGIFPGNIDLATAQLSVGNGGSDWATWSGSMSVEYDFVGSTWTGAQSTTVWSDSANWEPAAVPEGVGQTVLFGSSGATEGVTLDANHRVSGMLFSEDVPTTLCASNSSVLTLHNGPAPAAITVNGTSQHAIGIDLKLTNGAAVKVTDAGGALTLSGSISGMGGITKNGDGLLTLSHTNSYRGDTVVNAGTLEIANAGALPAGRALAIASRGQVVLSAGLSRAVSLGGLTITSRVGADPASSANSPPSGVSSQSSATTAAPTPEPGTIALLAAAAMARLAMWRRKRIW